MKKMNILVYNFIIKSMNISFPSVSRGCGGNDKKGKRL